MLGCFCCQGGLVHLNTANSTGKRCKKQRDFMTQNFETQPWHPGYDLLFNQCQYDHQRTWTFGSQARGPIFQLTAYSRSRKIIPMMTLIKSGGSQNLVTRLYEESSFKHDVGTCNIWFGVFFSPNSQYVWLVISRFGHQTWGLWCVDEIHLMSSIASSRQHINCFSFEGVLEVFSVNSRPMATLIFSQQCRA